MNTRLLRKIEKHITDEPEKFDMADWIGSDYTKTRPHCGTTCCIGGWAAVETGWRVVSRKDIWGYFEHYFVDPNNKEFAPLSAMMSAARKALNINEKEADRLFYSDNWPSPFQEVEDNIRSTKKDKAKNAVARIEHFIETGE